MVAITLETEEEGALSLEGEEGSIFLEGVEEEGEIALEGVVTVEAIVEDFS